MANEFRSSLDPHDPSQNGFQDPDRPQLKTPASNAFAPDSASYTPASFKDDEHKILWLQLALSKGLGPITFWKLLKKARGDLAYACSLVKNLAPRHRAEEELTRHQEQGFQILLADDPLFPQKLLQLPDCPPFLSFVGIPELLNLPSISIVGARNASLHGKLFAARIAHNLGQNGLIIVSGMARGIDSAAHEGSLMTGSLAVLAGGLDIIYPPENKELYSHLKKQGGILTEMPLGTAIEPSLFPRRNRLIAGLSEGCVLIEAAAHSGTLITAQYALKEGKRVFAVPGFPSDPRSCGCNQLLRQGATLTESAEDVIERLRTSTRETLASLQVAQEVLTQDAEELEKHNLVDEISKGCLECDNALKEAILHELGQLPISVEALFQVLSCSLPHLLTLLTELESEGKILRHPNNSVSLKEI